MALGTDISDAEQGEQEGPKGCGEGEEFPVPLEDLEIVRQACDDCLHATHLMCTKTNMTLRNPSRFKLINRTTYKQFEMITF